MWEQTGGSRRTVLKATGGALAALTTTGIASADPAEKVEVNVGFTAETGLSAARSVADEVIREFEFGAVTVELPAKAAKALEKRADVSYVEENDMMYALADNPSWGHKRVRAPSAGCGGAGADIAIIDTGIDSDHPDLQANLGRGGYAVACSGSGCNYGWDDDNGHGTHCAGIAAADDNGTGVLGVAPDATLHAVKVLNSNGGGSYSDIAAGIQWTANQGWDVASLSLGGGYSYTVANAVSYAYNNGVLVVAAAGNSGPCSNCIGYPAALGDAIAVTAAAPGNTLASFSSTGPQAEILAPGEGINSTYVGGGYRSLSGTSMACPMVAGAGALLMSQGYSNTQARSRLQSTADNIGLPSNEQGHGMLDVDALC